MAIVEGKMSRGLKKGGSAMLSDTHSILEIDAAAVASKIQDYIKQQVVEHGAEGVLIGLSGGIDSAVLGCLASRALGSDKVVAEFLFDRDSEKSSETLAKCLAAYLGIRLEIRDIAPAMRNQGVYSPFIMHFVTWSRTFNRLIQHFYCFMFGENPFASSLRKGSNEFEVHRLKHIVFNLTVRHFVAGFDARHIHRKKISHHRAEADNFLLIGAANRSESLVGWFVKDGIDDLYIQPLLGLYKTQVWQLAEFLKLPQEVRHQTPSPDMMRGITDEFGIGIPYPTLDIIFAGKEHGITGAELEALGPTRKQIELAIELNRISAWKRTTPHAEPPVTGYTNQGTDFQAAA